MRREINADELQYLYVNIGASIWHLQHVENTLASYILIKGIAKELNSLEKENAIRHQQELNKLTLGQLIGRGEKLNVIDTELLGRLKVFNTERKWVVHNSIFDHGDQLYTDQGRDFVFSRLESFSDEAVFLHKHIGNLITQYSVSKGASEREVNETAINHIKKLKGEV